MTFHPWHIVEKSPWPILRSFLAYVIITRLINIIYNHNLQILMFNIIPLTLCAFQWWRDITREATFQGHHTSVVIFRIKWGIILFIVSEIYFFLSFFWTYFHIILAPEVELGIIWPPIYINIFNPYNIPLLNTIILLFRGITVTWSHYSILRKNYYITFLSLSLTILLGIYFTTLQIYEYLLALFSISDRIFGSIFFISTGFHGLHVIIGTLFLLVNLLRLYNRQFSIHHHFRFEASIWYWHFVDVVWLFLYTFIYWWIF